MFIKTLANSGNVTHSSRQAGFDRSTANKLRREDEDFAQAWADALEEAVDSLREEAWRRARDGTEEPLVNGGRWVNDPRTGTPGVVKRYSDALMASLLKAYDPAFRQAAIAPMAAEIPAELRPDPAPIPDEAGPENPVD